MAARPWLTMAARPWQLGHGYLGLSHGCLAVYHGSSAFCPGKIDLLTFGMCILQDFYQEKVNATLLSIVIRLININLFFSFFLVQVRLSRQHNILDCNGAEHS